MGGGAGYDVFVFSIGSGRDMVVDFEIGRDQLLLQGIDPQTVRTQPGIGFLEVSWGTSDSVKIALVPSVGGDLGLFA
jgi:Ca2+-binding RTX toxin-like protein